ELARFLRLSGVDEKSVGRWIQRVSKLPADRTEAARYSNMSPELRTSLNARYEEELHRLHDDSALAKQLLGAWASPPPCEVILIRNVSDALLALGRTMGSRPPA